MRRGASPAESLPTLQQERYKRLAFFWGPVERDHDSHPEDAMSMVDAVAVIELKQRARILHHKALELDEVALRRLRLLPEFEALATPQLVTALKRRHALSLVARECGFAHWMQARRALSGEIVEDYGTLLYPQGSSAYWNIWSAHYAEAQAIRAQHGGFLLVYKRHYFIVEANFVEHLGLNPSDPDWERIGRDWARPQDPRARSRLYAELLRAQRADAG